MFTNWTRKLAGFALLVWTFAVVWYVLHLNWQVAPTPAEWATFLTQLAISAGIIVAVAAGKSIGTDAVNKVKSTNGSVTSEPTVTKNP